MTCASVNWKFDVAVISMCVVPTKISHQNCKKDHQDLRYAGQL